VLAIDPRAGVAANNLAYMDAEAGQNLELALHRALVAKSVLPNHAAVDDSLGWVHYKRGRFDLALQAFQQSVARAPTNPTSHYHLGVIHKEHGKLDLARAALEEALRLNPAFAKARRMLLSLATVNNRITPLTVQAPHVMRAAGGRGSLRRFDASPPPERPQDLLRRTDHSVLAGRND
jgi:tetratricopeptide (TPR) repeat protein